MGIGFERLPAGAPRRETGVSSAMLFHEPQSGHLPSHFGDWQPHF